MLEAALIDGRLSRETVAVLGPEEMPLGEAVRRVGKVIKKPPMLRMPVWFHYALALLLERTMTIPLVSQAQVRDSFGGDRRGAPAVRGVARRLVAGYAIF